MTAKIETGMESGTVVFVPLNTLKKSPKNARKTPHAEVEIEALAASIAVKGMLQNLVVEPERDADGGETGHAHGAELSRARVEGAYSGSRARGRVRRCSGANGGHEEAADGRGRRAVAGRNRVAACFVADARCDPADGAWRASMQRSVRGRCRVGSVAGVAMAVPATF